MLLASIALCAASAAAPDDAQLRFEAGQILVVGFLGTELASDAPILRALRERSLGGVILFNRDLPSGVAGRNVRDAEQLAGLIAQLRTAASAPLLVAVDQEGGKVRRLRDRFGLDDTVTPEQLGKKDDVRLTATHAAQTARVLAELGINVNLAPVVDLELDPQNSVIGRAERSYGKQPAKVVRHALAVIKAHHAQGLLTAIKHFPGHGSAEADSHSDLPDVTGRWKEVELEPFRRLIQSAQCDAIMTAHIMNRALDSEHPATLSRATIDGLLRRRLGWDGVVMSDDLGMAAITSRYDLRTTVALALNAGVDLLVFANNTSYDPRLAERVHDTVIELVASGEVSRQVLHRAYGRVHALKQRLGAPQARRLGAP